MARFYPPLDELQRLATPLNDGERRVLDLLTRRLDDQWHVFVQPHLLNHQPDFVIAAEHHGITVIEVKDWADGGHRGMEGHLEVRDSSGTWVRTAQDPIAQAHRYRWAIAERFLTPPGAASHFARVKGVVAMPQWATSTAIVELKKGTALDGDDSAKIQVTGREIFEGSERFLQRLIYGGSAPGPGLERDIFARFLARLQEPEAIADQRRPLRLSAGARDLEANPNNAIIRRVRGPAGSGKTVGLAARAARLAGEKKSVLVLSFNITLAHYIQDLVRRRARQIGADHRLVDCIHIHGFCADIVRGLRQPSQADDGDDSSAGQVIRMAITLYEQKRAGLPKYDAVLVDEGQDFAPQWWNFLRQHVRRSERCEMVLASDITQDIYGRHAWTNEAKMLGYGFSGRWTDLPGCYRLPADLVPIVAEFAAAFLGSDVDLPRVPTDHTGLAAAPTGRTWVNAVDVQPDGLAEIACQQVISLLGVEGAPHEADIVFLTNLHQTGLAIASKLNRKGIEVEHIFAETAAEQRKAKQRFWPGVAKLKGSTVHSFKGWEARAVVVVTDNQAGNAAELAYVALSRVKGDPANRRAFVSVVNTVDAFRGFKERFEREIDPVEVPALGGQIGLDIE